MSVEVFSHMVGSVISSIEGGQVGSERMTFNGEDGVSFSFYHRQDCCESVRVEDVVGDVEDLVGSPIVEASVSSSSGPEGYESSTWTFYRFSTVKGTVTVRWLGTSNGYYSERVDFEMNPQCGHPQCGEDCIVVEVTTE